ncbi:hypothetical protein RHMOL_Rhmol06G0070200 [Rhododendron molle]|uniref:Uncharacterized protein n=1 Tax=Rhododendron molle TaxID=49168 RepID=A0ACC0N9X0_RHOML|nr:hypothetical protein RHMOL_Rhmol06G0070200 [Rhododendron molle]
MRLAYALSFLSLSILATIAVLYLHRRSPFSPISVAVRHSLLPFLSSSPSLSTPAKTRTAVVWSPSPGKFQNRRLEAYFSWLDVSYCMIINFVLAGYFMDNSSIDPGPIDGSVLVLQKQHRSRAIWEGYGDPKVENVTLICRRNDNNFRQLGRPSPRIVELTYQAGFGGILEMPFITLDRAFITALIERWRPETHTFHLRLGESTVTLQDVEIITGLAVDGRPVTGDTRFDQDKKKELCERLLGLNPPGEVMSGFKVSLKWLRENFDGKIEEEDDEVMVLRKARGYILQLIGGIVLPDQSSSHVHLCFLSLLDDLQLAGTYSWGSACLGTLYHYLDFGSTIGSKDLGGMFVLLQVWGWERFPFLAPARNGKRVIRHDSPLSGRWDDEFHSPNLPTHVVGHYRFSLDVQKPDEVIIYVTFRYFVTNCWANNIINITDPDILVYPDDDPYLYWYERITLRFVSKMGAATNTAMQLFERLSMLDLSAEAVQAMAQKGVQCLKFQEKLFRKIAPEHKIRDPLVEEEFDEDYDQMNPHLQAREGVHQQNEPPPQHQPQGRPEGTHVEYQFEEPIATSTSGGPVHHSELSTPFSSTILNMDGVSMSPLLNYSPAAGAGGSQSQTPSEFDWANMQISTVGGGETISECRLLLKRKRMIESQDGDSLGQVTQLTDTIIQSDETPEDEGGEEEEEEEEVDMEGGGHVTPNRPRRTTRVSRPPRCGTGGHIQKKHGDTNHEKVVDAIRGRGGGRGRGRDLTRMPLNHAEMMNAGTRICKFGAAYFGNRSNKCWQQTYPSNVRKMKLLCLGLKLM